MVFLIYKGCVCSLAKVRESLHACTRFACIYVQPGAVKLVL